MAVSSGGGETSLILPGNRLSAPPGTPSFAHSSEADPRPARRSAPRAHRLAIAEEGRISPGRITAVPVYLLDDLEETGARELLPDSEHDSSIKRPTRSVGSKRSLYRSRMPDGSVLRTRSTRRRRLRRPGDDRRGARPLCVCRLASGTGSTSILMLLLK
jgi:hypothetical protein